MDVGVLMVAMPGRFAATARMVEELGFASLHIPDSQNLAPEVWGQLMIAAGATKRIRLGPGVSNSVTRDPALTACSALSLHAESGGRAVLGIGRGDSSVQRIGRTLDPVARFERYLAQVRGYLAGESVDRDGFASRLEWLPHARVPRWWRRPVADPCGRRWRRSGRLGWYRSSLGPKAASRPGSSRLPGHTQPFSSVSDRACCGRKRRRRC